MVEKSVRKVIDLPIDDILPNRYQPRIKFDDTAIFELSESIKTHGVFQPIIVRPIGDKYEIIAGERRYKASVLANKTTIPAIIMNLSDKDSVEVALIENVQRRDLTPIEEAISYKKILDMGYIKQEDLAHKLGKDQSTIANKLRLLNLDEDVQEALLENKISERHARSLLKLKNNDQQKIMLKRIINERLTVRRTDEEIIKMMNDSNISDNPIVIEKQEEFEPVPEITVPVIEEDEPESPSVFGFGGAPINATPVMGANTSTVVSSEEKVADKMVNATQVDIDKIESEAAPVIQERPQVNMEELMKSQEEERKQLEEEKKENPADELLKPGKFFNFGPMTEEVKEEVKPAENSFEFNNFVEAPVQKIEPSVTQNFDNLFNNQTTSFGPTEELVIPDTSSENNTAAESVATEPTITVPNPVDTNNVMNAVTIIRDAVSKLEKLGFNVDVDEIDLADIYQLIIKIDK